MTHETLDPGEPGDLDGTMAGAMMEAYNELLLEADRRPVPDDDQNSQRLFVAIATGVIEHLEEREEAFEITIRTVDES